MVGAFVSGLDEPSSKPAYVTQKRTISLSALGLQPQSGSVVSARTLGNVHIGRLSC